MAKQFKKSPISTTLGGAALVLTSLATMAGSVSVTNTFTAGSPASAAQVNQNFTDVETAVNDNDSRISALESAGGGTPSPVTINCSTASSTAIQDAIDAGVQRITLNGTCTEDIYIYRDDLLLTGGTLMGSSASFPVINIDGSNRVELIEINISGGLHNVLVEGGSSVYMSDVTLSGAVPASEETLLPTGVGLYISTGSFVHLDGDNTFTGGTGDTSALFALNGVTIQMTGSNNVFNAGSNGGNNDAEPVAVDVLGNSTLIQLDTGTGNQINGDLTVDTGSNVVFSSIALDMGVLEMFNGASLFLGATSANAITMTVSSEIEMTRALLDLGDDFPVTINPLGVNGTSLFMTDNSSLLGFSGSTVNMNVSAFRASTINLEGNSTIGGNLEMGGYSSASFNDVVNSAVSGSITCGNSEIFSRDTMGQFTDLCNNF